jgi:hypothetical protein
VESTIAFLRKSVEDKSLPWAAAIVRGFTNSAVSWEENGRHRNPFMEGNKDYVILVLPNNQYISFLLSGGNQV